MKGYLLYKDKIIENIVYLAVGIYILVLYLDIFTRNLGNKYTLLLKYSIIVLCFLLSLFIGKNYITRRDKYLVLLARLLTLLADYYLVLLNNFKVGILFFCFVQIVYIIRHTANSKKPYLNIPAILFFHVLSVIFMLNLTIAGVDKSLVNLALIYLALLLSSLFCSVSTLSGNLYKKSESYLIAVGMFLFFLCDINVGLFNFIGNESAKFLTGFLIWFFYSPSQLLLSLSGFDGNYIKKLFRL